MACIPAIMIDKSNITKGLPAGIEGHVAVVFSTQQANEIASRWPAAGHLLLLCVDVPRARFCDSVAAAHAFFAAEN